MAHRSRPAPLRATLGAYRIGWHCWPIRVAGVP